MGPMECMSPRSLKSPTTSSTSSTPQEMHDEARKAWRKHFARNHENLKEKAADASDDVSFTRWLCPSTRERQESDGIRNARKVEAWAAEVRQRWVEQNPKETWRSSLSDGSP
eukprot:TRINITY_DN51140_c0_g1_i1.p1 TRINITY_DN51140_c0_g1~~TRINITY_DN51140_c0_g1_i1.p1  ORF type:complete len:124 (+),score=19.62 TRINITY_DN51140_c0_g1_i1:39-374(+)